MREYEITFIVQPEISDEGVQAIQQRLDEILEKQGAVRLMYDDMGRRRLAYEIRNFQKGQYFTLFYLDNGTAAPEIERALRLDDSVLRFLTVMANPEVKDIAARTAEAAEMERIRAQKAAEKAAREAEEAERAAVEGAEAERAAAEGAEAEAAARSEAAEAGSESESEGEDGEEAAPAAEGAGADEPLDEGQAEREG